MDTYARKWLCIIIYLGLLADVTFSVICHYGTDKHSQKYCSERCCGNDTIVICCRYRSHEDKQGIYLGTILSAFVMAIAILLCLYKLICRRLAARRSSVGSYGSADYHVPSFQTDVSISPRQPSRVHHQTGENFQLGLPSPPPYDSLPPPYLQQCPEYKRRHHEDDKYQSLPPPPYSESYQSQNNSDTT